jgi:hypothetical protein
VNPRTQTENIEARRRAIAIGSLRPVQGAKKRKRNIWNTNTGNQKRSRISETRYRHCLEETVYLIHRTTGAGVYTVTLEPDLSMSGNTGFATHQKNALYLLGIKNYGTGYHQGHAIAAVHYFNKLYVFDPWGSSRLGITDAFGHRLAQLLGATDVKFYSGKNLQTLDTKGVCVALSSKLLMRANNLLRNNSNKSIENYFKPNVNNPLNLFKSLVLFERGGKIKIPKERSV